MTREQSVGGLIWLSLLAMAAVATAGSTSVIPAPTDLWQWILQGGLLALMFIDLLAFALDLVITTKAHRAALASAVGERDKQINDLVIEVRTLRERTGRNADRTDRLVDSQEMLTQVLSLLARQKQVGP